MRGRLLVTQRIARDPRTGERRDALDRRWHGLLRACDLLALPVPNVPELLSEWLEDVPFRGLLLTGGNDLASRGGDAPERDRVELRLLERALADDLPVLGVCRGMQLMVERFGGEHERVAGHVQREQTIEIDGERRVVNSFHEWGCRTAPAELEVWARADDGVVKAVRHPRKPVVGVMWHPERLSPFRDEDVALVASLFAGDPGGEDDG